jgi:hypothetical protein
MTKFFTGRVIAIVIVVALIVISILVLDLPTGRRDLSGINTSTSTDTGINNSTTTEVANNTYPNTYNGDGFTIEYPNGYKVDSNYKYQADPGKEISGVKFTIPAATAEGTNLSNDTYLSVEHIPGSICDAKMFLSNGPGITTKTVQENGATYSVASTTGAGAGNRYEETVYALQGSDPCMAVRYFVHYGVFENYPAGTIERFDQTSLLNEFDKIRSTLNLK